MAEPSCVERLLRLATVGFLVMLVIVVVRTVISRKKPSATA